jgi:hypothetical protein
MRRMSFAEVLDARVAPPERRLAWDGPRTMPLPGPAYAWWPGAAVFHRSACEPLPRAAEPPRPARALTAPERQALETLREAGAVDLHAGFTPAELKAAFRRLARSLHPDRHPGADATRLAAYAVRFARVRDAYLVLRTLVHGQAPLAA